MIVPHSSKRKSKRKPKRRVTLVLADERFEENLKNEEIYFPELPQHPFLPPVSNSVASISEDITHNSYTSGDAN
jgi:hypothetical protein